MARTGRPPLQSIKCRRFLMDLVPAHHWRVEFIRNQANILNLSWRTVEKAKRYLGITSHRVHDTVRSYWYWKLPEEKS